LGVLSSTVPSTWAVNSRTIRASLAFMGGPPEGRGERPRRPRALPVEEPAELAGAR
jgi:hypothetical protein